MAVRRSVAGVDWIQQVQCCISATRAAAAAQAEPTVTIGGAYVDGGEQRLADGRMVTVNEGSCGRLAKVVSTILLTVGCGWLGRAVARWPACGVGSGGTTVAAADQAREEAVDEETEEE